MNIVRKLLNSRLENSISILAHFSSTHIRTSPSGELEAALVFKSPGRDDIKPHNHGRELSYYVYVNKSTLEKALANLDSYKVL